MKFSKILNCDVIEIEAPANSPAIVILHGYGADFKDLAPLSSEFELSTPHHWYFINAPHALDQPYSYGGRMWFPIDMMALHAALNSGGGRRFFNAKIPDGFIEASDILVGILEKISSFHKNLIVGGFSQGSMVAAYAAFSRPELIKALILFSTTFIGEPLWDDHITKAPDFKIFQSHGRMDPVLPVDEAQRFREFLQTKGAQVEYHEFMGGHEIPYAIIESASKFLNEMNER
jgi:phospholipase/carboxylesterase